MREISAIEFYIGEVSEPPARLEDFGSRVTTLPRFAPEFTMKRLQWMILRFAPLAAEFVSASKSWIKVLEQLRRAASGSDLINGLS